MATTLGGVSALGSEPIVGSLAGTTLAGNVSNGTVWTDLNAAFNSVVTALVKKEVTDILRKKAVILQESAYISARNVKGTNKFVYTAYADLGAAEDLAEAVPPITVPLAFDTMDFTGAQKGKIVAISDLAEMFNPHEQYGIAAEKIAWNMVDTMELLAAVAIQAGGLTDAAAQATIAENIIANVLILKLGEVPTFSDGFYHCLISPTDAAAVMADTSALGWMESLKYSDRMPLLNGEIGRFRGVRFIETTRVADTKATLFGPEFFAWGDYQTAQIYRVAPGGDHADPLAQRGLVGWKGMFGCETIAFAGSTITTPAANPDQIRYVVADLTTVA
jgi:N4-gp56 family major capsid protein